MQCRDAKMSARKLLIIGATGPTGQQLLTQALEAGYYLTAFARTADTIGLRHERLRLVAASVTEDSAALGESVRGQDVVISALGRGQSFKSEKLIQRSVPPILSAMQTFGVRRLIFMSALGVGETMRDAPLVSRIFARLLLGDIYADKEIGEALICKSDLEWTLVKPPLLTNGPLTRTYRAGERLHLRGMPKMSRADVAHFILRQVDNPEYVRKSVLIAH
jgi:putative NADH-flavin reductase